MNELLIESNREHTKKLICKELDNLFNEIKKCNIKRKDLEKKIKLIEKDRIKLAYAYSRKIGVIVTMKEYNKKFSQIKSSGKVRK